MIKLSSLGLGLLLAATATMASAAVILPDGIDFGPLPAATFGGSGIPNTAVAQTTSGGVTLGLNATQRFSNPTVSNNGAGTFYAMAGTDTNPPSPADPYAKWNFNFYIGNAGQADNVGNYNYRLFYDFNPASGTDQAEHGYISLPGLAATAIDPVQNSYNLGMNFLASSGVISGLVITAPTGPVTTFDPNAVGEYTFKLAAYQTTFGGAFNLVPNLYGSEVFSTSMVVSAIPEPGEWAMMLAGLGVVGAIARRRRNK